MNKKNILDEIKQGILDHFYDRKREYEYIQVNSEDITIEELFEEKTPELNEGYILTNLFYSLQGVTVGGVGSTAIFTDVKGNICTDNDLILKTIGGRNIKANEITWSGEYMIFPYIFDVDNFIPAFYDDELQEDTLNFDVNLDVSEAGRDKIQRLTYRIAKGYIKYPTVAEYLCQFYDDLYYREFEGKQIIDYREF